MQRLASRIGFGLATAGAVLGLVYCQLWDDSSYGNAVSADYWGLIGDPLVIEYEAPQIYRESRLVFTDARLDLLRPDGTAVPGYFVGSEERTVGNLFHVVYTPMSREALDLTLRFCRGPGVALRDLDDVGEDCETHVVRVGGMTEPNALTRQRRSLETVSPMTQGETRYLMQDGQPFLKTGAGSPENILAYAGFDGTYSAGGIGFPSLGEDQLHQFEAHIADWNEGDPDWGDGAGKGIVGLFNYYESVGVNSQYMVGMNVHGDGWDVFPYVAHDDPYVFDVSKLAQWQAVLEHANRKGVAVHFLFTETENESFFEVHDGLSVGEDFAPSRKLYYREMVARFGHLPMLVWNLGEENGVVGNTGADPYRQPTTPEQRGRFADYIASIDPHDHPIVAHNWPDAEDEVYGPLLGHTTFSGISLQAHHSYFDKVLEWTSRSADAGRPWMVSVDEPLGWEFGARPDSDVDGPREEIVTVLWPTLLAGGTGVEWYFGWQNNAPTSDLSNEDQRTRDRLWRASAKVRRFFETLPLTDMTPRREGDAMVLEGAGHRLVMEGGRVRYTAPGKIEREIDPFDPR